MIQDGTYPVWYLESARRNLGQYFDVGVHDHGLDRTKLCKMIIDSRAGELIADGNPFVTNGLWSGIDLFTWLRKRCELPDDGLHGEIRMHLSADYWAGDISALFQWKTGISFAKIWATVPFNFIVRHIDHWEENSSKMLDDFSNWYQQRSMA